MGWRCSHSRALMLVRADWGLILLCVIQATTSSVDPDISSNIRVVIASSICAIDWCMANNSAWRYGMKPQPHDRGNTLHHEEKIRRQLNIECENKISLHNLFSMSSRRRRYEVSYYDITIIIGQVVTSYDHNSFHCFSTLKSESRASQVTHNMCNSQRRLPFKPRNENESNQSDIVLHKGKYLSWAREQKQIRSHARAGSCRGLHTFDSSVNTCCEQCEGSNTSSATEALWAT